MKLHDAASQLESVLLKQLLHTSGVFKGSDTPGSAHVYDLFAESLADAVAKSGGLGLARLLTTGVEDPAAPAAPTPHGFGPDPRERPFPRPATASSSSPVSAAATGTRSSCATPTGRPPCTPTPARCS
jgi:Rod binding domain-containing protein